MFRLFVTGQYSAFGTKATRTCCYQRYQPVLIEFFVRRARDRCGAARVSAAGAGATHHSVYVKFAWAAIFLR